MYTNGSCCQGNCKMVVWHELNAVRDCNREAVEKTVKE